MTENQQPQGEITKKFEQNIKNLVALLGGDGLLKNIKVENTEAVRLMEELFKEEREAKGKELKERIKDLIKKKTEYERFVKEKQREFDKAVEEKQKEFNKEAEDIFKGIENLRQIADEYYSSINSFREPSVGTPDPQ